LLICKSEVQRRFWRNPPANPDKRSPIEYFDCSGSDREGQRAALAYSLQPTNPLLLLSAIDILKISHSLSKIYQDPLNQKPLSIERLGCFPIKAP
jgi:hypothetical protein